MDYYIKIESLINEVLKKKIDNDKIIVLYYNIGNVLISQNDKNLNNLENYLKEKYGIVIGFTRRNFINMIAFSSTYDEKDLDILKKVSWKNHLVILKEKEKRNLLKICIDYNLNKQELLNYIKYKKLPEKINKYFEDDMLEELINLKKKQNLL